MTNKELTKIWDACVQGDCRSDWGCDEQASLQILHDRKTNTSWYRAPPETEWSLMERPGQAG